MDLRMIDQELLRISKATSSDSTESAMVHPNSNMTSAAMIVAAETFVAQHPGFNGSLAFLLTSDEEGDAIDGTARVMETLANRGDRIDWCLIGEPSSHPHDPREL